MDKKTIIRALERIALLMELQGENPFKVSAFRKAAQTLELDSRSLSEMEDPTKLKGIGAATGGVITDLLKDGESSLLKELEEKVPQGLVEMLRRKVSIIVISRSKRKSSKRMCISPQKQKVCMLLLLPPLF